MAMHAMAAQLGSHLGVRRRRLTTWLAALRLRRLSRKLVSVRAARPRLRCSPLEMLVCFYVLS
jgi:hypothetical protein